MLPKCPSLSCDAAEMPLRNKCTPPILQKKSPKATPQMAPICCVDHCTEALQHPEPWTWLTIDWVEFYVMCSMSNNIADHPHVTSSIQAIYCASSCINLTTEKFVNRDPLSKDRLPKTKAFQQILFFICLSQIYLWAKTISVKRPFLTHRTWTFFTGFTVSIIPVILWRIYMFPEEISNKSALLSGKFAMIWHEIGCAS